MMQLSETISPCNRPWTCQLTILNGNISNLIDAAIGTLWRSHLMKSWQLTSTNLVTDLSPDRLALGINLELSLPLLSSVECTPQG